MAFAKKTWKARLVEFAGRRALKNVATEETVIYDVSRNEGTVSQAGDAFSATNMNDLESRIESEFNNLNASGAITGYEVTEDGAYISYKNPGTGETVKKKLGSSGISGTLETVAVKDRTIMTRSYVFNDTGDYTTLVLNVKNPPNGGNKTSATVYGTAIGTSTYKQIQKIATLNTDVTVNIKGYDHIKLAVTASHSGNAGFSYEAGIITTYAFS